MADRYDDYVFASYFGEFYDDYVQQARDMLGRFDWSTIEHYMDREIAEDLHTALAPCENERFLLAYMMAHTEKFGDDFEIG